VGPVHHPPRCSLAFFLLPLALRPCQSSLPTGSRPVRLEGEPAESTPSLFPPSPLRLFFSQLNRACSVAPPAECSRRSQSKRWLIMLRLLELEHRLRPTPPPELTSTPSCLIKESVRVPPLSSAHLPRNTSLGYPWVARTLSRLHHYRDGEVSSDSATIKASNLSKL
jgi:hypothetical protein